MDGETAGGCPVASRERARIDRPRLLLSSRPTSVQIVAAAHEIWMHACRVRSAASSNMVWTKLRLRTIRVNGGFAPLGASNKVSGTMPRNESHRLRMLTAITANARPCNSDTLRGRSDAVALQSWDVPAQLACTPEFFTIGVHLFTSLATKALNAAGVDP